MAIVRPVNNIFAAYNSTLVFEAIKEDPDLKVRIFKNIDENNDNVWYFTNTSSIPITELDEKVGLDGRVIGFHFYNPPAVQKLVELIRSKHTTDEVNDFALAYAKKLRKVVVPSNDYAGFIGNGHFMRDALHAISEVERLSPEMGYLPALYTMNKVSQDYLVRPMGIFQLIDYVGVEVCSYIMSVMNPYLPNENLHSDLLDKMVAAGITGGQYSSGAQKDGFLKYAKGQPVAIFDIEKKEYVDFAEYNEAADAKLGEMPAKLKPWKAVNFNKAKAGILEESFAQMNEMETFGVQLAKKYNTKSNEIGKLLVSSGVAACDEDVNKVMLTGFYHAYGPINNYL